MKILISIVVFCFVFINYNSLFAISFNFTSPEFKRPMVDDCPWFMSFNDSIATLKTSDEYKNLSPSGKKHCDTVYAKMIEDRKKEKLRKENSTSPLLIILVLVVIGGSVLFIVRRNKNANKR